MNVKAAILIFFSTLMVGFTSSVCPVTFEKHGCDYVIQGDDSKPLLEEKLMTDDVRSGQNELLEIDDVTGVNESLLSDFTCKCANMAKDKQDISMAISVEYSTVANDLKLFLHLRCFSAKTHEDLGVGHDTDSSSGPPESCEGIDMHNGSRFFYSITEGKKCDPFEPLPPSDFNEHKKLLGTPLQRKPAHSEFQCADFCFRNHRCVAFNIQLMGDGEGKRECQLMGQASNEEYSSDWGFRKFDYERFRKVMFGENPCSHDEL